MSGEVKLQLNRIHGLTSSKLSWVDQVVFSCITTDLRNIDIIVEMGMLLIFLKITVFFTFQICDTRNCAMRHTMYRSMPVVQPIMLSVSWLSNYCTYDDSCTSIRCKQLKCERNIQSRVMFQLQMLLVIILLHQLVIYAHCSDSQTRIWSLYVENHNRAHLVLDQFTLSSFLANFLSS